MKTVVALFILWVSLLTAAPAQSFPKDRPTEMKLSSPGLTFEVNWSLDVVCPEAKESWRFSVDEWSEKQVAITGHSEKNKDGLRKLIILSGIPDTGDNFVRMHAIIYDGYERDERDFILTWKAESWDSSQ